ncbi:MAG: YqhA family protein [Atopobiaceae bacterium]|jgi:uncharacterized membrane protein YqhA|nr:YqhA family protein [Atopobiaceae bacterium]MCH4181080.1 YqhA family protein [Atopobiaceae bacterium]MCH4213424.1 YqhA family protein [Atopobiaceae bacterium]MCH4230459.1 YqhA family protein [Atopobiaceae bacterium]MCH4277061.1 YqhA family protein [Atopobiaceae bacterium]
MVENDDDINPEPSDEVLQGDAGNDPEAKKVARKVAGWTRFIAGVPAVGLFICAVVLAVETFLDVMVSTIEVVAEAEGPVVLATEYVEYADLFLLAVALYILSLGMFTLFVTDKVPLPSWLEFHDFDDLKERLIAVIVVMLAVYFLGLVLKGEPVQDLLVLGLAIGVIIFALTFFVKFVFKAER